MSKINQLMMQIGDTSLPFPHRLLHLADLMIAARDGDPNAMSAAGEIFHRLEIQASDDLSLKRSEMLQAILKQLESTPLRMGTFIRLSEVDGSLAKRAMVVMENGDHAYVVAPDQEQVKRLKLGDKVMLDGKGCLLIHPAPDDFYAGLEARYERLIDDCHVEVVSHQDEKSVVLVGPEIVEQVKSGKVVPGMAIVIGAKGVLGVKALPQPDKELAHFRFLDRGALPDVRVDRDIGCPPPIIRQLARHIREEMVRPELRRKYKLRPCITRLFCGGTGTGKTLAVQAIHRQMYEIMSEVTGDPIEKLPPRVFRFRNSQMLSMWLGESDKNADRLFDEVEQLAARPYKNEKGEFRLPVLVVMEEADGVGRARGQEAIYDRILTTILQRLDPNRAGLSDRLVVFISTTNEANIVDPAFLRRIGGAVERFGRLNRESFVEVFRKHTDGLPTDREEKSWKKITDAIAHWLFEAGVDPGIVELQYQGHSAPAVKYRRDFLTGALIDRSVQEAATMAWELSLVKESKAGLTQDHLKQSINHQVMGLVHQLSPQNADRYVDVPEGARVVGVKKIN